MQQGDAKRTFILSLINQSVKAITSLAYSSEPVILDLARELMPQTTLKRYIDASYYPQEAVTLFSKLYPAGTDQLLSDIFTNHPEKTREVLETAILKIRDDAVHKQLEESLRREAHSLSPEQRVEALHALSSMLATSLSSTVPLTPQIAERARTRIALAQMLMSPLPISGYRQIRQKLETMIDAVQEKLAG